MTFYYLSTDTTPVSRDRAIQLLDQGHECTVFDYPPDDLGRFLEYDGIEIIPVDVEDDDGNHTGEYYYLMPDIITGIMPEYGHEAIEQAEKYISDRAREKAEDEAEYEREQEQKARRAITGTDLD